MELNTRFYEVVGLICAASFFVAFILTFWPSRLCAGSAALLFAIGIVAKLSAHAYSFYIALDVNSGFFHVSPIWWALPSLFVCYGIAASALLWPSLTQERAMRFGKILHLVLAPLLIALLVFPWYHEHRRAFDLTWLVYALLWFRIREGYDRGPNHALQATAAPPSY
jgi:hypothetical protein